MQFWAKDTSKGDGNLYTNLNYKKNSKKRNQN